MIASTFVFTIIIKYIRSLRSTSIYIPFLFISSCPIDDVLYQLDRCEKMKELSNKATCLRQNEKRKTYQSA